MLNTKLLMTVSALLMGALGIILNFLPEETMRFFGSTESNNPIIFQILGATYFGFAMVNWTAKANLIGGIYGRPIAIGNFSHFLIAALALVKVAFGNQASLTIILAAIVYSILALMFGYVLFTHPLKKTASSEG